MTETLKDIEEALEKATPGPWYVDSETTLLSRVCAKGQEPWNHVAQRIENTDAHLIANAPTWLLHQQNLIEQLQAEIATMQIRLNAAYRDGKSAYDAYRAELNKVEHQAEEIRILREALEWYAEKENHRIKEYSNKLDPFSLVYADEGKKARFAIQTIEKEE